MDAALNCSKCQTPLPVGESTFSIPCPACGQWHIIKRGGPVVLVEPIGAVEAEPAELVAPPAEQPQPQEEEQTPVNPEINRLDQDWLWERKQYYVFGWQGGETIPTIAGGILAGVIPAVLGFLVFCQAKADNFAERLLGLVLVVGGIAFGIYRLRKALAYQQAYEKYQRRRQASQWPGVDAPKA
jgi:hypothetical protein